MRRRSLMALPAALALAPRPSRAQDWKPAGPVRFVIPFPPGSAVDLVGRLVAEGAGPALGQNVVVENRPGGGTLVAVQAVKAMPADGQAVLVVANSFTVNPTLHKPKPYDPLEDFTPLALLVETPHVLVCPPAVAASFGALIEKSRQPGPGLSFGSNGQGTSQHMGMEQLKLLAGMNAQHVPYRGVPPMLTDLLAGRLDYAFANLPDVLPAIRDRQLVPLGLIAPARHRLLPDVPTFAELGYPQAVSDTWYGMVMPAGARPEVAAALSKAWLDSLNRPATRARMQEIGLDVLGGGAPDLVTRIRRDTAIYAEVVRAANITPG